jgi:pantoate ligase / CMP/dCMP kinase
MTNPFRSVSVRLFTTIAALGCYLNSQKSAAPKKEIGLVPTMGALHAGHLSLIQRARQENAIVVVSIFVNPLQFGPKEDFQDYPRNLEQDRLLCEQAGVDAIFAPSEQEMFGKSAVDVANSVAEILALKLIHPSSLTQVVPPPAMTSVLCGKSRPGHFQGVAAIVTKILSLVQPTRAYFGQKDAQQVAIIRKLVADFNLPVEIVACSIVREASGLAMSSRNQYLTQEQKQQASVLYRALQQALKTFSSGDRTAAAILAAVKAEVASTAVELEYAELVDPNTLAPLFVVETAGLLAVAARIGSTRLIDNIILRNRRPIVAIDGPAGAGKSTVTRKVAQALGLCYLDTGAMYRAVTWLAMTTNTPISDECAIAELVNSSYLEYNLDPTSGLMLKINGEDVTEAIRSLEVTSRVSEMAAHPVVRKFLVEQQRRCGIKGSIVAEGRDIGTNVFPDAELKIFLTASVKERSRRRLLELKNSGAADISLEQLEQDIEERDEKDSTREVAPLRKAADAVEIQTDGLSIAEVIDRIVGLYKERILTTPQS